MSPGCGREREVFFSTTLRSDRPRFIKGLIWSDCSALLCVTNVYVDVKGSQRKRFESFFLRTLPFFHEILVEPSKASTFHVFLQVRKGFQSKRSSAPDEELLPSQLQVNTLFLRPWLKVNVFKRLQHVCVCVGACRGWCRAPGGSRIPACITSETQSVCVCVCGRRRRGGKQTRVDLILPLCGWPCVSVKCPYVV